MPPESVVGWDIGGAHIKAAVASSAESISKLQQLFCPLWLGTESLRDSLQAICKNFNFSPSVHTVTMTGELVDHFGNRKEGVAQLVNEISANLQISSISFYAGNRGFIDANSATSYYKDVASANWLASASYVAKKVNNALFIDVGSTTSDIVRITDHRAVYEGYNDAQRLYAQELVYCGVVRTPVFALCRSAPIDDKFIPIMNECFSNTADVYRLTRELPGYADLGDTLDGRDKDVNSSATRLARMFGYDAYIEEMATWKHVAEYVREQQLQMIINACRKQLTKFSQPQNIPIVGAGVGRFLIREIAQRFNRKYIDFENLCKYENSHSEFNVGDCAPAAAVACLGYQRYCS